MASKARVVFAVFNLVLDLFDALAQQVLQLSLLRYFTLVL